jgi:Ca-activated chloride channel homolog
VILRAIPGLAILVAAAAGQTAPPPGVEDSGAVFRAETSLVVCHTTVLDKDGRLITDLPKGAFKVFENGAPQEISVFRREDIPVSAGLVIDNSSSMADKRAGVEAAALALVKASNPEDEVFIVNFSDEAFVDNPPGKPFTSDIQEMEAALRSSHPRGETAMRDALRLSIDHLQARARKDKRVLVVVTDGDDNRSIVTQAKLLRAAQQAGVVVYCVGLLTKRDRPEAILRAREALTQLAEATGGEAFFPEEVAEVDRIARQVARDIRNQYTIEYSPSNQALDGSYRRITITVDDPLNPTVHPTVRTREGYYASAEAGASKAKPPKQ